MFQRSNAAERTHDSRTFSISHSKTPVFFIQITSVSAHFAMWHWYM